MKTYGAWRYTSAILKLRTRWRSSSWPCRFNPRERAPDTHCTGDWVDPTAGLEAMKRRKILTLWPILILFLHPCLPSGFFTSDVSCSIHVHLSPPPRPLRDCVVGIATSYGLDDRGVAVRVPVGSRIFLFSAFSRPALGPTELPIQWVPGALSPGVKRPGCEADHPTPTSAEVKKMSIYTSTPPYAFMA
jgi:hypothetical protein